MSSEMVLLVVQSKILARYNRELTDNEEELAESGFVPATCQMVEE